ncbi:hypothetical protein EJB05_35439, partial [Eragrostis curvula]
MAPAALLPLAPTPPHPSPSRRLLCRCRFSASRRDFTIHTAIAIASTSAATAGAAEAPAPSPQPPPPTPPASKPGGSVLSALANTKSWPQHYGSGFSIRVPPSFEDILEPEVTRPFSRDSGFADYLGMRWSSIFCSSLLIPSPPASQDYSAGMTYYGDKAKPRAYEARFASPDRDELVSVVIKPSNQLKITFLEAKDIADLGTLKEASKIFVPAGAKIYAARTIKVKDDEDIRTYYFYEFGVNKQHVALMAAVNSGKTYIAAATAPQEKWDDDGVKLRSAAVSLSVS